MAVAAGSSQSPGRCVVTIGGKALGAQSHAIVIPDTPTPQERHAAKELQSHLAAIIGEEIPVVSDAQVGNRTPIVVGKSALPKKLGVEVDFRSLGTEGIAIKTAGPALVLAGNTRGVLYACYTFLEDYLNCRWFTPDCTVLPKTGRFDIPQIDRQYVPPLEYRALDYPNTRDPDWAVRNRINGDWGHQGEEHGGKVSYRGFVHTFDSLVPPEKYFAEHPEYYSEIGGKRVGPEHTQLCLTNPEVLRIATETVLRWIEEAPEATIFSVSQNDWDNYCECANCRALAEKEGGQSGPLLHFVDDLADAIWAKHPDKVIDTLAYQYTRKPPRKVKPRPNVVVRLCSIECCFVHPLESDSFNESFRKDIEGWSKICKRLWIWDYVINYSHSIMPFPNLYALKPNINFFIRNGVIGIYEESNYYSKGGELAELRSYIMAKTLWDPQYDTDRATDEFLSAYYEEASAPIREYINLVHQQVRDAPELHVTIYSSPDVGYLTPDVVERSVELFDQAERVVAHKPRVVHRVQVARLPVIYTQIALAGDAADPKLVDRFEKIARAEGVTMVAEGVSLDEWLEARRKKREQH